MERWGAAGFAEQDAHNLAKQARDQYKDTPPSALRNLSLTFAVNVTQQMGPRVQMVPVSAWLAILTHSGCFDAGGTLGSKR